MSLLLSSTSMAANSKFVYQAGPGVHEELTALAAAERTCCSFVTWAVSVTGDRPVLHVTAPPEQPEALAPIAALFGATAQPSQ